MSYDLKEGEGRCFSFYVDVRPNASLSPEELTALRQELEAEVEGDVGDVSAGGEARANGFELDFAAETREELLDIIALISIALLKRGYAIVPAFDTLFVPSYAHEKETPRGEAKDVSGMARVYAVEHADSTI